MKILLSLLLTFTGTGADTLPVREWNSPAPSALILFITGDAGFGKFSTELCDNIHAAGYDVCAINAKAYFWNKKTPEQTSADITAYLEKQFSKRDNQQLILAGYSFGADVMPFIVNRLPNNIRKKLVSLILISPSTSTYLEIHLSDMLGGNKKRSMDVVAEINKLNVPRTVTIFGSDENDFPVSAVKLERYSNESLPGGHHFNGDAPQVARTLLKYFK
ncbi:AcvB/VirJ family lysyl-phosphatidylglycerol hydrolase [Chitinophaga niabensis]|uniref:Virulence protein (VirJ) n=1 Tax=Chitinophaga niabensis TaxID=536979 RepID=A0A1N6FI55_9BACT|nr:AcvB/VirJ family lysyl-phosphatidylglycerol hydrolase [Chitinophaga niabensis]SIN94963.1 virulence protein (VirJ) [Chitinophaga niabensis]